MRKILTVTVCLLLFCFLPHKGWGQSGDQSVYKCINGMVSFISEAPLETITAQSMELKGVIDTSKNIFAFSVSYITFLGFNSPLQKEHFNENYMESDFYPTASFSGKFIENIDYSVQGIYELRAKGVLNIHGIKQERIIKGKIIVKDDSIVVSTEFSIPLIDHNIRTPKIVHQKIAPEIDVKIEAVLLPTTI